MRQAVDVETFRRKARLAIRRKFEELLNECSARGSLQNAAAKLGVSHTMLGYYVKANRKKENKEHFNVPAADVLLAAMLKEDWKIRIDGLDGEPCWCEFGLTNAEGGTRQKVKQPTQMSLFEALADLDHQMDSLKKSVGRAELEVHR